MMGRIDGSGRALVRVHLRASAANAPLELDAWIDTGFTGDLVLPKAIVSVLQLPQSGTTGAELGDGSTVILNTYTCWIDWFEAERQLEVVANNGQIALLGVGLLRDHRLVVDYAAGMVTIE